MMHLGGTAGHFFGLCFQSIASWGARLVQVSPIQIPARGVRYMPHDDFWAAINKRVEAAAFFLNEMSKDIQPPSAGAPHQLQLAATVATGVVVSHPWQESFYYHFDAFLAMTRSVPEIIRWLFGVDYTFSRFLRWWRTSLNAAERARRRKFQSQFATAFASFVQMPLSDVRNVTLHRTGVAPVEVRVMGRWGSPFVGTPLQQIPLTESLPVSVPLSAAGEPLQQLEPCAADFSITITSGGTTSTVGLFPESQKYLEAARKLVADARKTVSSR
jgi:hypothetical protein